MKSATHFLNSIGMSELNPVTGLEILCLNAEKGEWAVMDAVDDVFGDRVRVKSDFQSCHTFYSNCRTMHPEEFLVRMPNGSIDPEVLASDIIPPDQMAQYCDRFMEARACIAA